MAAFDLTGKTLLITGATVLVHGRSPERIDGLREATPDAQAADAEARRRLWAVSEELTARR